jgi:Bromodomain
VVCTADTCTNRQQAVGAATSPLRDHDCIAAAHAPQVLKKFLRRDSAAPFAEPVPLDLVPGYAEAIARPADLGTVLATLQREQYATLGAPRCPCRP